MKKMLPVLIIVILLLLGAGAFFLFKGKTPSSSQSSVQETSANPTEVTSGNSVPKTLKELFTSGVAQKCTFTSSTGDATVTGVSYISGGKMRADMSTKTSAVSMNSHMILDGKTSYVWTDGQQTGFKMTIDPETMSGPSGSQGNKAQEGIDMNKAMDYQCSAWVTDPSLFTAPAGVTFTDYSSLMTPPSGAVNPASGNAAACSACNGLTGDAQAQCKSALKCP